MRFVDLHTHTQASDGSETPEALVRRAQELGLKAVAITDHDTVDGLPEAEVAAHKYGIELIRGCELAAQTPYGEVHILGLWLPQDIQPLTEIIREMHIGRQKRNELIVERLRTRGFDITDAEVRAVAGDGTVGRPHIARVMLEKNYVKSIGEAFQRYLGYYGQVYLPRELPPPDKLIRALASLGATVSLAHPCLLQAPREWLDDFVANTRPMGLMAIEAYHSEHDQEQTRFCVALAQRHNLCLSGGSDFHGISKPGIELGIGRGGLRVPEHVLETLKEQRRRLGLPCDVAEETSRSFCMA